MIPVVMCNKCHRQMPRVWFGDSTMQGIEIWVFRCRCNPDETVRVHINGNGEIVATESREGVTFRHAQGNKEKTP